MHGDKVCALAVSDAKQSVFGSGGIAGCAGGAGEGEGRAMIRVLIIDEAARRGIERVLAHAEAHPHMAGCGGPVRGDDPNFVIHLSTYRVVFSFTHLEGVVYRHLSVSVPGSGGGMGDCASVWSDGMGWRDITGG